jgi:hypothetical protein
VVSISVQVVNRWLKKIPMKMLWYKYILVLLNVSHALDGQTGWIP